MASDDLEISIYLSPENRKFLEQKAQHSRVSITNLCSLIVSNHCDDEILKYGDLYKHYTKQVKDIFIQNLILNFLAQIKMSPTKNEVVDHIQSVLHGNVSIDNKSIVRILDDMQRKDLISYIQTGKTAIFVELNHSSSDNKEAEEL